MGTLSATDPLVRVFAATEPQRIFELLGRTGELARDRLELRDAFAGALNAYRRRAWAEARAGFESCLGIVPCDGPSKAFLSRITQLCATSPSSEWNGVWSLTEK